MNFHFTMSSTVPFNSSQVELKERLTQIFLTVQVLHCVHPYFLLRADSFFSESGIAACLHAWQRALGDNIVEQNYNQTISQTTGLPTGGGGFFHSKGTWGCAVHKGILLSTSSLAKGILLGNFSRV